MGAKLTRDQVLHAEELRFLLKKANQKVSMRDLKDLIQEIEANCSWYPSRGSLRLDHWQKIGKVFHTKEPRAPVKILCLWYLCKSAIEKFGIDDAVWPTASLIPDASSSDTDVNSPSYSPSSVCLLPPLPEVPKLGELGKEKSPPVTLLPPLPEVRKLENKYEENLFHSVTSSPLSQVKQAKRGTERKNSVQETVSLLYSNVNPSPSVILHPPLPEAPALGSQGQESNGEENFTVVAPIKTLVSPPCEVGARSGFQSMVEQCKSDSTVSPKELPELLALCPIQMIQEGNQQISNASLPHDVLSDSEIRKAVSDVRIGMSQEIETQTGLPRETPPIHSASTMGEFAEIPTVALPNSNFAAICQGSTEPCADLVDGTLGARGGQPKQPPLYRMATAACEAPRERKRGNSPQRQATLFFPNNTSLDRRLPYRALCKPPEAQQLPPPWPLPAVSLASGEPRPPPWPEEEAVRADPALCLLQAPKGPLPELLLPPSSELDLSRRLGTASSPLCLALAAAMSAITPAALQGWWVEASETWITPQKLLSPIPVG